MVMYPNYVLGETTLSLLQMHLALYEQSKEHLQQEHPMALAAVKATMPRACLELGLLYGQTEPISSALNQDKNIPPYSAGEAIILALKKNNNQLCAIQLEFAGNMDQIDWKEWRIEAIAEQEFTDSHFAPYAAATVTNISGTRARLYTNEAKPIGRRESNLDSVTLEMTIKEVKELGPSQSFRYAHELEFSKSLTEQERSAIASLNKAQYL
jgi:hypothetical protein